MDGDHPVNDAPLDLAELLGLQERARETHRLTKKDIVGQWEASAPADARLLNRAVSSARIVGVITPATTGIAAVRDPDRTADMIPVIDLALAGGVKRADRKRVAELMHRAMPRPAVLGVFFPGTTTELSLALTRPNRTDEGRSVIEAHLLVSAEDIATGSLRIANLDRSDLGSLYRDLVRTAAAGGRPADDLSDATEAVRLHVRLVALDEELQAAMRRAAREKTMQRRIEVNAEIRAVRARVEQTRAALFDASHRTDETNDPKVGP